MKNEKNNIASWIAFVIFLPALPLIIKFLIFLVANKNLFNNYGSFIQEWSLFALLLSIDNIKELFIYKRSDTTLFINARSNISPLHIIIFSIVILILTTSLALYVMTVIDSLTAIIGKIFDPQLLKWGSGITGVSSFFIGLTIQIHIFIRGI